MGSVHEPLNINLYIYEALMNSLPPCGDVHLEGYYLCGNTWCLPSSTILYSPYHDWTNYN